MGGIVSKVHKYQVDIVIKNSNKTNSIVPDQIVEVLGDAEGCQQLEDVCRADQSKAAISMKLVCKFPVVCSRGAYDARVCCFGHKGVKGHFLHLDGVKHKIEKSDCHSRIDLQVSIKDFSIGKCLFNIFMNWLCFLGKVSNARACGVLCWTVLKNWVTHICNLYFFLNY